MGSHKNRVCIWNSLDVLTYQETGAKPPCLDHEHVSLQQARELTSVLLYTKIVGEGITQSIRSFFEYDWVRPLPNDKISVITQYDVRVWVIKKSGGYETHQLVRMR